MSLVVEAVSPLDKNHIQINEYKNADKNTTLHSYIVLNDKADVFVKILNRENNALKTLRNIFIFAGGIIGGLSAGYLRPKNKTLKILNPILGGIAGGFGAGMFHSFRAVQLREKLIKEFDAKEIK